MQLSCLINMQFYSYEFEEGSCGVKRFLFQACSEALNTISDLFRVTHCSYSFFLSFFFGFPVVFLILFFCPNRYTKYVRKFMEMCAKCCCLWFLLEISVKREYLNPLGFEYLPGIITSQSVEKAFLHC